MNKCRRKTFIGRLTSTLLPFLSRDQRKSEEQVKRKLTHPMSDGQPQNTVFIHLILLGKKTSSYRTCSYIVFPTQLMKQNMASRDAEKWNAKTPVY